MTKRLVLAAVLALALLAGAAPAAVAQDNGAVAINTKDGSSLFKLAFSIKQVGGEVVDQTNAAVAYANCEECQTVAIAVQVLIVTADSPDVVTPTNLALALNEDCDTCTTMALAYQFVLGGQPLTLTAKGRRELARIRHELLELGKQGLSAEEIRDRTTELVGQLRDVLATELVPRGPGEEGDQGDGGADGGGPPDEQQQPDQTATDEQQPPSTTPENTSPQDTAPTETAPQPGTQTAPQQPQDNGAGGTNTTP